MYRSSGFTNIEGTYKYNSAFESNIKVKWEREMSKRDCVDNFWLILIGKILKIKRAKINVMPYTWLL